jgi:hypothetical protein
VAQINSLPYHRLPLLSPIAAYDPLKKTAFQRSQLTPQTEVVSTAGHEVVGSYHSSAALEIDLSLWASGQTSVRPLCTKPGSLSRVLTPYCQGGGGLRKNRPVFRGGGEGITAYLRYFPVPGRTRAAGSAGDTAAARPGKGRRLGAGRQGEGRHEGGAARGGERGRRGTAGASARAPEGARGERARAVRQSSSGVQVRPLPEVLQNHLLKGHDRGGAQVLDAVLETISFSTVLDKKLNQYRISVMPVVRRSVNKNRPERLS